MNTRTVPTTAADSRTDTWLLRAAAFFALSVIVHNGDHLRRGAGNVSGQVFALGTLAIVTEVAIVVVIGQRHRVAPLAAAVIGVTLATGYVVVHFLPARSWASDSFVSAPDVSWMSWFAASFEVVAALVMAGAGLAALSVRGGLESAARPSAGERPLADGLRHPLALAFAISQVVILAVSFAQL